jgi:hypothetical protein
MPHSLYLGSGIVQPRLREYDERNRLLPRQITSRDSVLDDGIDKGYYVPSLGAIKHSLTVSVFELAISLFTFALFVNSAILIVAGASPYNNPNALDADIFDIHDLLSKSISPAAGIILAPVGSLGGNRKHDRRPDGQRERAELEDQTMDAAPHNPKHHHRRSRGSLWAQCSAPWVTSDAEHHLAVCYRAAHLLYLPR